MTRSDHGQYDALAVGWALHALEPGEEHAFGIHLATCPQCQRAVAESEEALGRLAYEVPLIDPPPYLLDRIRQATGASEPARPPSEAAPAISEAAPLVPPTPLVRRQRVPRWAVVGIAAALVLIALLSWNIVLRGQAADAQRVAAQRREVISKLTEGSSRAALRDGGNHTIGYVLQRGTDVQIVADGMAPNDRTKTTYVLWAVQGSGAPPVAVGTFDIVRPGLDVRPVNGQAPGFGFSGFAVSREAGRTVPDRPSQVIATGAVQG
jgi:anti-sigma-K factor RskA